MVILTTLGGYIEVVQRIVETIRHHYSVVDFLIPNCAFSAGTVFALSGDAIHMDYYSRLGPIDPQVERLGSQKMVPALGYLAQYARLVKKAQEGTISVAETQLMIDGFDQAELYQYEQSRELSVALLKDWLVKYKFKDWETTHTRRLPVTPELRAERAQQIAVKLNDTERWHTHGHGISMEVLRRDLNLIIDDFGAKESLNEKIRGYHGLLDDYMSKMNNRGVLHTVNSYVPFA
jgi:hypothetical protein